MLAENAAEEAAAAAALGVRRVGAVEDLRCLDEDLDKDASAVASRLPVFAAVKCCCPQSDVARRPTTSDPPSPVSLHIYWVNMLESLPCTRELKSVCVRKPGQWLADFVRVLSLCVTLCELLRASVAAGVLLQMADDVMEKAVLRSVIVCNCWWQWPTVRCCVPLVPSLWWFRVNSECSLTRHNRPLVLPLLSGALQTASAAPTKLANCSRTAMQPHPCLCCVTESLSTHVLPYFSPASRITADPWCIHNCPTTRQHSS